MRFPDEVSTEVIQRLRRVEGQIRGIQRLIEHGAECREVVTQLAAAKAALDRAGFKLMAAGMRECARDGADLDAEELERLFLKLS